MRCPNCDINLKYEGKNTSYDGLSHAEIEECKKGKARLFSCEQCYCWFVKFKKKKIVSWDSDAWYTVKAKCKPERVIFT